MGDICIIMQCGDGLAKLILDTACVNINMERMTEHGKIPGTLPINLSQHDLLFILH